MKDLSNILHESLKKVLNETVVVKNYGQAYEVGKEIYKDLLQAFQDKHIFQKITNPFKKTYTISLGKVNIPVHVTYPTRNSNFCWYYPSKKSIEMNINGMWQQNEFFSLFFHELTHAIDYLVHNMEKRGHHFGNEFLSKNRNFGIQRIGEKKTGIDVVNNILYRLWDTSERNAYQLISVLGEEYCKDYIKKLQKNITYLKGVKASSYIWRTLARDKSIRTPKRVYRGKPNVYTYRDFQSFKNFFIKKSQHLLDVFSQRIAQNIKYFNEHPIEDITLPKQEETKSEEYEKSNISMFFYYTKDKDIRMVITKSKKLVNEITNDATSGDYERVIFSDDKNLSDFLAYNRYVQLIISNNRFYDVTKKEWAKHIEENYHCKVIYPISEEKRAQILQQQQERDLQTYTKLKKVNDYLNDENSLKEFTDALLKVIQKNLKWRESDESDYIGRFTATIAGLKIRNVSHYNASIDNDGTILIDISSDWDGWDVIDLEYYTNGEPDDPEWYRERIYNIIEEEVYRIHMAIIKYLNKKREQFGNSIPHFRMPLKDGNVVEYSNITKENLVANLKAKFPNWSDDAIEKIVTNPKFLA